MLKTLFIRDFDRLSLKARQAASDVMERHDVPRGPNVPLHLRDEAPRFFKTADGFRVTSRLSIESILNGSASVAAFLMNQCSPALLAILGMVSIVSTTVALILSLVIAIFYAITDAKGGVAFGVLFALGIISGLMDSVAGTISDMVPLIGYFRGAGVIPFLFFVTALLLAFKPVSFLLITRSERERQLIAQSMAFSGESSIANTMMYESHINARQAQYEAALKDNSPFLRFGTSMGVFAKTSQDGFAPDEGLPYGMTLNDIKSSHLLAFGTTGSGKTTSVLKPIIRFWMQNDAGGALIADGKGTLGREMGEIEGVHVISPTTTEFALIQGLNAEEVVAVFAKNSGGNGGNSEFFITSGANLLFMALILLEKVCTLDVKGVEGRMVYEWHLMAAKRMVVDADYRQAAINAINDSGRFNDELDGYSLLSSAVQFFAVQWPQMAQQTSSGVLGQVMTWLDPILSHRDLVKWGSTANGFDITSVLRGEIVALDTPATLYQGAGTLVSQLAKAQVYRAIKRRDANWSKDPAQTYVMILIDEAQELISEAEEGPILAMARSLGCCMVASSQSADAIIARILSTGGSQQGAQAMFGNFRSTICLKASPVTVDYMRTLLGSNMRRVPYSKQDGIAYGSIAKTIIESGTLKPRSKLLRFLQRYGSPAAVATTVWRGVIARPSSGKGTDGHSSTMVHATSEEQQRQQQQGQGQGDVFNITTGYSMEPKPVLDTAEDLFLNEKFVAVCQVQNAGGIRRDFVRFEPQ